jgi:hypothetical protein
MHIVETLQPLASEFRANMIKEHCQSAEDAIALATVLAIEAQNIWEELGGKKQAAAQFYRFADRCAAES